MTLSLYCSFRHYPFKSISFAFFNSSIFVFWLPCWRLLPHTVSSSINPHISARVCYLFHLNAVALWCMHFTEINLRSDCITKQSTTSILAQAEMLPISFIFYLLVLYWKTFCSHSDAIMSVTAAMWCVNAASKWGECWSFQTTGFIYVQIWLFLVVTPLSMKNISGFLSFTLFSFMGNKRMCTDLSVRLYYFHLACSKTLEMQKHCI